jgi:hypothetical protein
MWMKCLWPNLIYYLITCREGLKKENRISVRIINISAEIRAEHVSNKSQKRYCYSHHGTYFMRVSCLA